MAYTHSGVTSTTTIWLISIFDYLDMCNYFIQFTIQTFCSDKTIINHHSNHGCFLVPFMLD